MFFYLFNGWLVCYLPSAWLVASCGFLSARPQKGVLGVELWSMCSESPYSNAHVQFEFLRGEFWVWV